jgi:hypothetical protein
LAAERVRADTFQLANGETLSGEVVSFDENGLMVRLPDGISYSERISWTNFTQADLRRLRQNEKIAPLVEPFIEITPEERLRQDAVEIKPAPRLKRPESRSLLGALFSSVVGVFVLLVLYAANLYAAYEVSIFRARPAALVCGVSAVLPLIGPIVFFSIPPPREPFEDADAPPQAPAVIQPFGVRPQPDAAGPAPAGGTRLAQPEAAKATSEIPQTQIFQRGAFTFNRRFFETRFPGFFSMVRRDADKDMVLVIRSARGHVIAHRISRIAANELHVQPQRGPASEDVMIPFSEIQEVQLKHVNA